MLGMAQSTSNKKIANSLVAAGTAAVLAVYAAGYTRTQSAADKLEAQSADRRPGAPEGRGEGRGPAPAGTETRPLAPSGNADLPAPPVEEARMTSVPSQIQTPVQAAAASTTIHEATPSAEQAKSEIAIAVPVAAVTAPSPVAPSAPVAVASPAVSAPVVVASVTPPAAVVAPPPPAAPAAPKYKDGSYTGWGTSRHGDIQAEVIIENGRIVSANIAQCLTRYSCNVIGRLPPEVPQRQSAEVDYVSGATQSTNAYYYAVTEALGKAK